MRGGLGAHGGAGELLLLSLLPLLQLRRQASLVVLLLPQPTKDFLSTHSSSLSKDDTQASYQDEYFQNQLRITEGIVDTSHDANNERPPGEVFSLSLL